MNMRMVACVAGLFAMTVAACAAGDKVAEVSQDHDRMGWIQGDCLAIRNADVKASQPLVIMSLDAGPIMAGTVTGSASSAEQCPALGQGRAVVNKQGGYHFYVIRADKAVSMAVGVLDYSEDDKLAARACTTSEGVKFSVSSKGKVVWTGYDYLGYDTQPTCR